MKLADYIANRNLAIATEIYNANAKSPDDIAIVLDNIETEVNDFVDIISTYYRCVDRFETHARICREHTEKLRLLIEFKNSEIGKLIAEFTYASFEKQKDLQDVLARIQREMEISNPFGIEINRTYNGYVSYFWVNRTQTSYAVSRFDLDNDIKREATFANENKRKAYYYLDKRNEMLETYGDCLLTLPVVDNDNWD